jgi:light-regulated signal transduction histidine kinase (bacteriophytochrome)
MTPSEQKLKRIETEYREFVNALSHDLAGPFRHVIGFSQMIMSENEASFDEKTKQQFNFILTAGNDGRTTLDNLKAYARLTENVEPVKSNDISQLITSIFDELNDLILKNKTEIDIGSLPEVTASPDLLRTAFYHIIKNAIMYSNTASSPTVRITGVSTSTHIMYEVIDNGIGMTDYQTKKVLLVLKRAVAPADYPGNGMGLAIAKKAVEYHNGTIDIESSPESGTKVSISFPRMSP